MATRTIFLAVLSLSVLAVVYGQAYYQPEQIHIAYGVKPTEMVISWVTLSPTKYSVVEYGPSEALFSEFTVTGTMKTFVDGGSQKRKLYMHSATLPDLYPGRKYYYHCGSSLGWSSVFHFTAMRDDAKFQPSLAIYGDLGNSNAQSLGRLQEEVQNNMYDAILHVGDFAYNMDTSNALVGDEFMRQVETVAAYIPYMTCVGNHESAYNFSNYMNRFNMPGGDGQSIFYSFNIGQAHIIGLSTEVYFYIQYGLEQILRQFRWLERDLQEANKPENRAKRPWIITMGHRPMYCSNHDNDDCTKDESRIRTGIIEAYGLEDLFYKYGVDIQLWAHEHSYERLWPVYNRTVCNGTDDPNNPYKNAPAPTHIITGSGGCSEIHDHFGPFAPWTANRSLDYGYTRMKIINATHVYMEQVSDDKDGQVIDRITVVRDKHGPFSGCQGKYWEFEDYAADWIAANKGKKPKPPVKHGRKAWYGTKPRRFFGASQPKKGNVQPPVRPAQNLKFQKL